MHTGMGVDSGMGGYGAQIGAGAGFGMP